MNTSSKDGHASYDALNPSIMNTFTRFRFYPTDTIRFCNRLLVVEQDSDTSLYTASIFCSVATFNEDILCSP